MQKLFKSNYTIQNLNAELLRAGLTQSVANEIQLLVSSDNSKLSVVLETDKKFMGYFGFQPQFDYEFLKRVLKEYDVSNPRCFWRAMDFYQNKLNLCNLKYHKKASDYFGGEFSRYEIALLGQGYLQMASNFGYSFSISQSVEVSLKKYLNRLFLGSSIEHRMYKFDEKRNEIHFLGVWSNTWLKALDKKFSILEDNNTIVITDSGKGSNFSEAFNDDYFIEKYYHLITADVYYSGVMPSVVRLQLDRDNIESKVKYLTIQVVRTTFVTVDAMDNPDMIKHPHFYGQYKDVIQNFYNHEDEVQKNFLHQRIFMEGNSFDQNTYEDNMICNINLYLRHSYNTHTVAVSGNIETSDGLLLVGKRNIKAVDSGSYYCSVNGQSEFCDDKVEYYRKSVFEDLPTLNYASNYRLDLNGEIEREAIAELGISQYDREWEYYGLSYLNVNNDHLSENQIKNRRMHFNVLMNNRSLNSFEEINNRIERVTENFENDHIAGYRINIVSNLFDLIFQRIRRVLVFFYDNIGVVSTFFILLDYLIKYALFREVRIYGLEILSWIELIVFIALLILNSRRFVYLISLKKVLTYKNLFSKKIKQAMSESRFIDYIYDKEQIDCHHLIEILMRSLYILDKIKDKEGNA